ncbi:uncharacterized protein LOC129741535 [Uranotaenia lowii]|uniref:uncharacterized protein LOC129741535 n=1 Tax=Uranotaenia lowii TaxID=190385 RepID=UPI00247885F6|nr:uncharacterized protein LOC129741535 [Uranotaenia lowii]
MKDLLEVKTFLGMTIKRDITNSVIEISQSGYVETFLQRFENVSIAMGKAARRSVASDPSSPTLPLLHSTTTTTKPTSSAGASPSFPYSSSSSSSSSFRSTAVLFDESSESSSSSFINSNSISHPSSPSDYFRYPPKAATLQQQLPAANSSALDPSHSSSASSDSTGPYYTPTSTPKHTTPVLRYGQNGNLTESRNTPSAKPTSERVIIAYHHHLKSCPPQICIPLLLLPEPEPNSEIRM